MRGDIGWVGLLTSLILVAIAVGISVVRKLKLERSMVWAAARAMAQLLLVGYVLTFLLAKDRPIVWSWLWVFVMIVVAAATVARRAKEVPAVFWLALAALGASALVAVGVLFALRIFPLEPYALVPLSGIMIGNAMTSAVLVSRRVYEELRDQRDEVEARLALGLSASDSALPYVRSAMRTALIPQIESTKAVGLVALPGAMTGLILAGYDPLKAVMVQIAVMYLVLGSVAIATLVVGFGIRARMFTSDHRLALPDLPISGTGARGGGAL